MGLCVKLYWSVRSPYCYILLPRMAQLRANFDVDVDVRFVHPAAIRNVSHFLHMDALERPYFGVDTARAAAFHGMKFGRPVPDPIDQDPRTLAIAAEQPIARRLGRLGIAASERGRGFEFCQEVATLIWSGTVIGWDQGNHLAEATKQAGLALAELDAAIAANPDKYEAGLDANDRSLRAAGHWGVPTMVFEGEPFFGQDRFETLVWRMKQRGLSKRYRPKHG